MKLRGWGQGNHLITLVLGQECGCGETLWLMTRRSGMEAVFECINPACRTELVVTVSHEMTPGKNIGKPLPENRASLEFYQKFTRASALSALDRAAGGAVKCFICASEGAMTGALKATPLKTVRIDDNQAHMKQIDALCCSICRTRLRLECIVHCKNTGCSHWSWKVRAEVWDRSGADRLPADAKNADIVIAHWECRECLAERTGWIL